MGALAEGTSRNTVAIAIAGIAATAVVGLAGTVTAWLNARADRASQRALAQDDRIFEQRAKVYLDAIGLLQFQRRAFKKYERSDSNGPPIPYRGLGPHLTDRMIAFGSAHAVGEFQKTEARSEVVVRRADATGSWTKGPRRGQIFIARESNPESSYEEFFRKELAFTEEMRRFEASARKDLAG
jgi:hypothetical protein